MNAQLFQVLTLVFSATFTVIGVVIGFSIKSFLARYNEDKIAAAKEVQDLKELTTVRLNSHSNKLDDHEKRITQNTELISSNNRADEADRRFMEKSFGYIEQGLHDIKNQQDEERNDIKELDRRLTGYIIQSSRDLKNAQIS